MAADTLTRTAAPPAALPTFIDLPTVKTPYDEFKERRSKLVDELKCGRTKQITGDLRRAGGRCFVGLADDLI